MLVFGRLGGMRELVMAGAAFALVLVVGFVLVWLRGGRIIVRRSVQPTRTPVGGQAHVHLTVEATGALGLGPVLLTDRVPRELGRSPRLALGGGAQHRTRAVAYTITPRMRGRYTIGPLEISHTDPFGAVRRRRKMPGTGRLLVLPTFEPISVLPTGVQRVGIVRHSPLVGHGDEFFALRAYEEGDDLRKIHWPTSMRSEQLFIRQEEILAEPRALIVLDTTAAKHRGRGPTASLEAAVSACASVGVLALRRRMRLELVTPEGSLFSRTPSEQQLLEALAIVGPSKGHGVAAALERANRRRAGRPALIVVITPELRADELRALAFRGRGSVAGAIVLLDAASFGQPGVERIRRAPAHAAALALPIMRLKAGQSFRHVWHTGISDVALAR